MAIRVPFVDLAAEHAPLRGAIDDAIRRVLDSSRFVLGPEVQRFENDAAKFLGAPQAVGVSNASDALVIGLQAVGVGPGDDVITTPYSFFASTEAILRVGARPRFVDVNLGSLCLDAELVANAISPRTRALLPVHLFGSMEGIEILAGLSAQHGVPLVEDAAQAFGSARGGRAAGTWGTAGCFSFFPTKVLGALGDGGLVVARDPTVVQRCRALREHGRTADAYTEVGGNFRLDAVQAAVLGVKLEGLRDRIARRREHGRAYDHALARVPGIALVTRGDDWNGAVYTLRVLHGRRDLVKDRLATAGVETVVYYPRPIHLEPALAHLGVVRGAFPRSEQAALEVLSLPVFPTMTEGQRDTVIDAVRAALS